MSSEAAASDPFEHCAYCGDRFDRDVWYPVVTRRDEAGELQVYSFCDESCQAAWDDGD